MKPIDLCALGELLIDFTQTGVSPRGNPVWEANPGGAPCNVLAMAARLGCRTAFLGKVGGDAFGRQLRDTVSALGIDTGGLVLDDTAPTTLAFVHTAPDGDRSFTFYRNPGADMLLQQEELAVDVLRSCRIFHFGSLSLTHPACAGATKRAVELARDAGALISFDPNLRPALWDSMDHAREQIRYGISQCDILKISDDELLWFTGAPALEEAVARLRARYPLRLLLVTLGKQGSRAYTPRGCACVPAPPVSAVDTTGAGDTFCGCVLAQILARGDPEDAWDDLPEILAFANAAAALVTTRRGALQVMPEPEEIRALRNHS